MRTIALLALVVLVTAAAEPVFVTSERNGGWSTGGYYVHNNMWNSAKYSPCTQTLYAWSHDSWYVLARMNNQAHDGAVKTYPNVHKDYGKEPLSSLDSLTSTFAETSPQVGIYNVAFDIWVDGIATPGCKELMIWTENHHQVPGGKHVQDVTFGDHSYKVYKTPNGSYLAFVASTNFTYGTVNLLEMMNWATAQGWLSTNATLSQVCFGVEIVSTAAAEAKFQVTAFSLNAKRRGEGERPREP